MTTLKDLLEQAKLDRDARSGRALAKIASDHGHQVHATQVNHILAGTYRSRPSRQLLEAISWLAQVDLEEVYSAAGLPLPGPSFANELPPDVDRLAPHQRQAVITLIRAFINDLDVQLAIAGKTPWTLETIAAFLGENPTVAAELELPSLSEAREARRQRFQADALPQTHAGYDDKDDEPEE